MTLREKVARAIANADESNGALPYEARIAYGKHEQNYLFDRADAAIAIIREECAKVAEDEMNQAFELTDNHTTHDNTCKAIAHRIRQMGKP